MTPRLPELVEVLRRPTCNDADCRAERYEVAHELEQIVDAEAVEAVIICGERWGEHAACELLEGHGGRHRGRWSW